MTGRARRRAFLLGCNSGGLEHCACDARRLGEAFGRLGYHLAPPPAPDDCPSDTPQAIVEKALRGFLRECQPHDTALIYFSGHSRFQYGVFDLVVGTDLEDRDHRLNVESLIGLFKQDPRPMDCVLILDCCQAAAAVTPAFWNAVTTGVRRARVWVPARDNEYALERPGGSLLTDWIIAALKKGAPRFATAGALRINDLDELVRDLAGEHRSKDGRPVPIPTLLGASADNIQLADWAPGFPPTALEHLHRLLAAAAFAPADWQPLYEQVRHHSALSAAAGYRGPTVAPNLKAAVDNLADASYRPSERVQVPLAEFVERIAALAPTNADPLRAWLREHLRVLAGDQGLDAFIAALALGQSAHAGARPESPSYLAIALHPRERNRPTQYAVEAFLVDRQGCGQCVAAPPDLIAKGAMPTLLRDLFRESAVQEAMRDPERTLAIEFFLPPDLLGVEVDDWTPPHAAPDDPPLSARHPVTVRARDRLGLGADPGDDDQDDAACLAAWSQQWAASAPAREQVQDGETVPPACVWVPQPRRAYQTLARDGGCVFILGFQADGAHLRPLLRAGVAAALWSRGPLAADFVPTLLAEVARVHPNSPKRPCLADLPLALLHLRQDAWDRDQGHTGQYHLLWDDPTRQPRFTGGPADRAADPAPTPLLSSPY